MKTIFILAGVMVVLFLVVPSKIEAQTQKPMAEIIVENANLRESANASSEIIREVTLGERLVMSASQPVGVWYKVFDAKTRREGWLHGNTFKVVAPSGSAQPRRKLPIRAPVTSRKILSRKMAGEMIAKSMKLPLQEPRQLGRYWSKESYDDSWGVCMVVGSKYADNKQWLDGLQVKGFIVVGEEKERKGTCTYIWATVDLTEEGKKYLYYKSDGGGYVMHYSVYHFGEVTGIQIFEQSNSAIVDYTLTKTIVSPFWGGVSPTTVFKQARFALYDDGWRIMSW